jgi:hypothetical protein
MIFNPIKVIAFTLIVLAWILMTFFFIGCSNTNYRNIPDGMCEDSQNYSTKYNLMDSPDGSQDPNINAKILSREF